MPTVDHVAFDKMIFLLGIVNRDVYDLYQDKRAKFLTTDDGFDVNLFFILFTKHTKRAL